MARRRDLRAALWVSVAAVGWTLVSGAASVVVGARTGSTALVGTGADVLADLLSSTVLVWRFRAELAGHRAPQAVERRAHLVAAGALLVVGAAVGAAAVGELVSPRRTSSDAASVVVAALTLVSLLAFAAVKLRIAGRVPSPALRVDAQISTVGAATAAISLVGLGLVGAYGWTRADPSAALAIALLALATGIRGVRTA